MRIRIHSTCLVDTVLTAYSAIRPYCLYWKKNSIFWHLLDKTVQPGNKHSSNTVQPGNKHSSNIGQPGNNTNKHMLTQSSLVINTVLTQSSLVINTVLTQSSLVINTFQKQSSLLKKSSNTVQPVNKHSRLWPYLRASRHWKMDSGSTRMLGKWDLCNFWGKQKDSSTHLLMYNL